MTLNQFLNHLKTLAAQHAMINDFGIETAAGSIYEPAVSSDLTYPVMWAAYATGNVYREKTLNLRISLHFMDLIDAEKTNEVKVQSDMATVGLDIYQQIKEDPELQAFTEGDVVIDFFTERLTDLTAGAALSFTVKLSNPFDLCAIPVS